MMRKMRRMVMFLASVLTLVLVGLWPVQAAPGCDATFPAPVAGVDQQAAIQAVIDGAPDGVAGDPTTLCFPAAKNGVVPSYRIEGMVTVHDRAFLKFVNEATWNRTAIIGDTDPTAKVAWAPQLSIRTSHDVTWPLPGLNLNSVGTCAYDQTVEGEAAVYVRGSVDVALDGFDISGPAGDGYEMGWYQVPGQGIGIPSDDVHITGGTVTCVGRQGVAITSSMSHSSVTGITFDDAARSTLDLEMAGTPPCTGLLIEDFTFSDNVALDVQLNFVAGGGCGTHEGVHILDNTAETLKGKYGSNDGIINRHNITFDGNFGTTEHLGPNPLLAFANVENAVVTNNSQAGVFPNGAVSCASNCPGLVDSGNSWN
jgi:hypothetical protein